MQRFIRRPLSLIPLLLVPLGLVSAADRTEGLKKQFPTAIHSVVGEQCVDCHGPDDPDGGLDLTAFESFDDVAAHLPVWGTILKRVEAGEMPPEDSGIELSNDRRTKMVDWIRAVQNDYIDRHAGDPGEVLAHRLSSSEYNYTIRDLTGVDIRPADEFPVDPANEAGFDNSGESLVMTPSLMNKYIQAARTVSQHLVFTPDGIRFAPHPVVTETDRDKYCVRRIVDFYDRQNTDLSEYLLAAMRAKQDAATVDESVTRFQLSRRYLRLVTDWLAEAPKTTGPLAEALSLLEKAVDEEGAVDRKRVELAAEDLLELRASLGFEFPHLSVSGINRGSQPLVLWRNRQKASHRMTLNHDALRELLGENQDLNDQTIAAYEAFCRIIPDRYYVDRRGREYVNRKKDEFQAESDYRLLSAGFHSMMGYFRDDAPLVELMLSQQDQRTLDRLWFELDFIADAPRRQHSGFIWFERAEGRYLVDPQFDDYQAADKDVTDESKIMGLRDVYLAKAESIGAGPEAIEAMKLHFETINRSIREVEASERRARSRHLDAVVRFAEKAYRRPLEPGETEAMSALYEQLIAEYGLTHQDAIRDVVVSVLVSPRFCYRSVSTADSSKHAAAIGSASPGVPLDDYDLASRLSYFLWSSMPDQHLIRIAGQGKLQEEPILRGEVRRMLRDPKARGLAVEFGGNWLGARQFLKHQGVDRERFPQFDDELQAAMYEEPIRFTLDLIRNNRSVLDFLYADHTFVNPVLASHYDIPVKTENRDRWTRIDRASRYGRGGILPMAVFMTKNSPGLRTSPVKRGYWVVRNLLGTEIPPPPPNVPELPDDESKLGDLTLRQLLEKHRDHSSCSGCHEKFDSFGLVFESYGPIGERRALDLSGKPVDVTADFPDGVDREGIDGLRGYLKGGRETQFVETFCRKLLSFALGRSITLSDRPLIDSIVNGPEDQYRFESIVMSIVTSPQFRNQRPTP